MLFIYLFIYFLSFFFLWWPIFFVFLLFVGRVERGDRPGLVAIGHGRAHLGLRPGEQPGGRHSRCCWWPLLCTVDVHLSVDLCPKEPQP